MNRRGFLASIVGLIAAPKVAAVTSEASDPEGAAIAYYDKDWRLKYLKYMEWKATLANECILSEPGEWITIGSVRPRLPSPGTQYMQTRFVVQ